MKGGKRELEQWGKSMEQNLREFFLFFFIRYVARGIFWEPDLIQNNEICEIVKLILDWYFDSRNL